MKDNIHEILYQFVGDLIRQKREQAGMNQTALAKRISISRVSIVNIEHGRQRPPLHVLWSIAEALKVQLRDLIPLSLPEQGDPLISANANPELNKIQDWNAKDQHFVKSIMQRAVQKKTTEDS